MIYEYRCIEHPNERQSLSLPMNADKEWTYGVCPVCGEPLQMDLGTGDDHRSNFKQTFGKWTGVYAYDYGKKATWDLTPKGKYAELKRRGTIGDPFDKVKERTNDFVEV